MRKSAITMFIVLSLFIIKSSAQTNWTWDPPNEDLYVQEHPCFYTMGYLYNNHKDNIPKISFIPDITPIINLLLLD